MTKFKSILSGAVLMIGMITVGTTAFAQDNSAFRRQERVNEHLQRQEDERRASGGTSSGDIFDELLAEGFKQVLRGYMENQLEQRAQQNKETDREDDFDREQPYRVVDVIPGGFLNMRSGPEAGYAVRGLIPSDSRGITIETCVENRLGRQWCWANFEGRSGWVSATFLRVE